MRRKDIYIKICTCGKTFAITAFAVGILCTSVFALETDGLLPEQMLTDAPGSAAPTDYSVFADLPGDITASIQEYLPEEFQNYLAPVVSEDLPDDVPAGSENVSAETNIDNYIQNMEYTDHTVTQAAQTPETSSVVSTDSTVPDMQDDTVRTTVPEAEKTELAKERKELAGLPVELSAEITEWCPANAVTSVILSVTNLNAQDIPSLKLWILSDDPRCVVTKYQNKEEAELGLAAFGIQTDGENKNDEKMIDTGFIGAYQTIELPVLLWVMEDIPLSETGISLRISFEMETEHVIYEGRCEWRIKQAPEAIVSPEEIPSSPESGDDPLEEAPAPETEPVISTTPETQDVDESVQPDKTPENQPDENLEEIKEESGTTVATADTPEGEVPQADSSDVWNPEPLNDLVDDGQKETAENESEVRENTIGNIEPDTVLSAETDIPTCEQFPAVETFVLSTEDVDTALVNSESVIPQGDIIITTTEELLLADTNTTPKYAEATDEDDDMMTVSLIPDGEDELFDDWSVWDGGFEEYSGDYWETYTSDVDESTVNTSVPRLLVKQYRHKKTIYTGEDFPMEIELLNTSKSLDLENIIIKVELTDALSLKTGTNTLFINQIKAGESSVQRLNLSANMECKDPSQAITLSSSYDYVEKKERKQGESSESIMLSVHQKDRLDIQEPVTDDFQEATEGVVSIPYINKGATTLYNMEAKLDMADASAEQETVYLGNIESGKNGTIDFLLTPQAEGDLEGTVTIRYEDSSQKETAVVVPLNIHSVAAYVEEPLPDEVYLEEEPEETGNSFSVYLVIIGICVLILAIVLIVVLRRKRIKNEDHIVEDWFQQKED